MEPIKGSASSGKHIVFEVEVPSIYTDDIDALREVCGSDFESESEFLLNTLGEPGVCRLRIRVSGEKDSSVEEVWGYIRGVRLDEPSRGYETDEPHLTEAQCAENGDDLVRDEDACNWCQWYEPRPTRAREGSSDA